MVSDGGFIAQGILQTVPDIWLLFLNFSFVWLASLRLTQVSHAMVFKDKASDLPMYVDCDFR